MTEARLAARKIADFLQLELRDAVEQLEGATPPRQPATQECLDPPEDCKVVLERHADGITLTVPPAGIWFSSKGMFLFSLLWTSFTAVIGTIMVVSMSRKNEFKVVPLSAIGMFAVIGVSMFLGAINMGRRRAVLAVVGDQLMILQTGIYGSKRREWQRGQLESVRTGPSGMSVNGVPILELQVIPKEYGKFGLLAGHDDAELKWMATVLRQSLQLPAENASP